MAEHIGLASGSVRSNLRISTKQKAGAMPYSPLSTNPNMALHLVNIKNWLLVVRILVPSESNCSQISPPSKDYESETKHMKPLFWEALKNQQRVIRLKGEIWISPTLVWTFTSHISEPQQCNWGVENYNNHEIPSHCTDGQKPNPVWRDSVTGSVHLCTQGVCTI